MFDNFSEFRPKRVMRILSVLFSVLIGLSGAVYPARAFGMSVETTVELPAAGSMLETSPRFQPAVLQGMTFDPAHPLQMEFIVNPGDRALPDVQFLAESQTLIKYFLTALTVPEDRLWVNLSPYEQDRIIPADFGETEMGRELLAQDYLLKQLSASMMYPEKELGREFWSRVHTKALQKFGTTEIPMNTFNKVWIVPETAVVHRAGSTIMVTESHMKVMLEEDYLALSQHSLGERPEGSVPTADVISGLSAEIVRQALIPEIEREVNEGENF
ncbi:MAG: hypothetical protein K8I00_06325, partial [Candidatus Omnitrophica bacterium]|nr:hypothetical protein [Candidatus Omnitrophota bacterium]